MPNELTVTENNTHVVVLWDGTMFPVDENRANAISAALAGSENVVIRIGGATVNKSAISYLAPVDDVNATIHRKAGEWQCSFGHWHARNEHCPSESEKNSQMVDLLGGEKIHVDELIADESKFIWHEDLRRWERKSHGERPEDAEMTADTTTPHNSS